MKILICGIKGKMGSKIKNRLMDNGYYDIVGFDKDNDFDKSLKDVDIVVDFTNYNISKEIIKESIKRKIPIISGTTGYNSEEIDNLKKEALKLDAVFIWSPNYSKGYKYLLKTAKEFKKKYSKCDIIEFHNLTKIDKPSGSAIEIAKELDFDLEKINSVRINNVLAMHSVILNDDNERFIITHEITNRDAFVDGFIEVFNELVGGKLC